MGDIRCETCNAICWYSETRVYCPRCIAGQLDKAEAERDRAVRERDALREAGHGEATDNVRLRNELFPLKAALARVLDAIPACDENMHPAWCTAHQAKHCEMREIVSEARAALKGEEA